jgi:hypothetical protein
MGGFPGYNPIKLTRAAGTIGSKAVWAKPPVTQLDGIEASAMHADHWLLHRVSALEIRAVHH